MDAVLVLENQTAAPAPVIYVIAIHVPVVQCQSVQVAQLAQVAQAAQVAQVALAAQLPAGHAAAGRAPAFNALKRAHAAIVANAKVLLAQIARALALVHAASAAHAVVDLDVRRYHDAPV